MPQEHMREGAILPQPAPMPHSMDKHLFLDFYIYDRLIKIRVIFNADQFLHNQSINIASETVSLATMISYYVPVSKKREGCDCRGIEERIKDADTSPLTLDEVSLKPSMWGLEKRDESLLDIAKFYPIPLATDLKSGGTLLLDSNHTLANMVHELDKTTHHDIQLPVLRVSGQRLEDIVPDFYIVNRTLRPT